MKKLCLVLLVLLWGSAAHAQQLVSPCVDGVSGCVPVSAANPLPTTGGGGGGGTVNQGTPNAGGVLAWFVQLLSTDAGVQAIVNAINSPLPSPAPAAPTVGTGGAITSLVLKNAPTTALTGGVFYFHGENATATAGYCVLYNGTAAPSTGALTAANVLAFQLLPANSYCDWIARGPPITASAGAVVLLTSAANPYTYTTGAITGSIYGLAQ